MRNLPASLLASALFVFAFAGAFLLFQGPKVTLEQRPEVICEPSEPKAVPDSQGKFHSSLSVWSVVSSGQIALSVASLLMLIHLVRDLFRQYKSDEHLPNLGPYLVGFLATYLLVLLATLLVLLPMLEEALAPLSVLRTPVLWILITTLVCAAPGIVGIWLVHLVVKSSLAPRIEELKARPGPEPRIWTNPLARWIEERKTPPGPKPRVWTNRDWEVLEEITSLREKVQRFLLPAGALIGAGTLGAGALRAAVLACDANFKNFPHEYLYLFGLFFTAVLALVFFPAYNRIEEVGYRFLDLTFPLSGVPPLSEQLGLRSNLENSLGLGLKASETFRAGVAILTPLAGALLSALLTLN